MKMVTRCLAALLPLFPLTPVRAQDDTGVRRSASVETWLVEKPILGKGAYKGPNRPIWRLADLKKMHAGKSNWTQQIVLDDEQNATYHSGAPGTKVIPRMHPDTPTAFVVIAGQIRFTVEGQEPVVAKRTSIINIMKGTVYSYEVVGSENALWIEDDVRGYSNVYPVDGPRPLARTGDEIVKVAFADKPAPYVKPNRLHFNTLDAIASCTVGPAVQDDRLYLTPNVGFANPADDMCNRNPGGNASASPAASAAPFDDKLPFGHLHSGAVEWWIVQLGGIDGKFENRGEVHAVEGDVLYAPPGTWHLMTPEGPGPSVRLTMGAYQRIVMQNTGPAPR